MPRGEIRTIKAEAERLAERLASEAVQGMLRGRFEKYAGHTADFARDVFGVEFGRRLSDGQPYQKDLLDSFDVHDGTIVTSGQHCGKTAGLVFCALGFLLSHVGCRVVVVLPVHEAQLKGVFFAELRRWLRVARRRGVALPLEVRASSVRVAGFGLEWALTGMSASGDPALLEGIHAGEIAVLLDEVKAFDQPVFESLAALLASPGTRRLVAASVPGLAMGQFHRWATEPPAGWVSLHWRSDDSTLCRPSWPAEVAATWGPESPVYRARVEGAFITEGEGALVSLAWLEAARAAVPAAEGPVTVGVDCAASTAGDESVIAVVQGNGVRELVALRTDDPNVLTERVLDVIRKYRPQRVRVDAAGVGTAVVANLFRVPLLGCAVERVWFGGAPTDATRFTNLRAEMHWRLRERLEAGTLSIGRDEKLAGDLSVLRYSYDQRGRIVLEGKPEARRRLGRSPDRSDALCLALGAIGAPTRRTPAVAPFGVALGSPYGPGDRSSAPSWQDLVSEPMYDRIDLGRA